MNEEEFVKDIMNGQKSRTLFTSEEYIYVLSRVDKKKMYNRSKMWKRKVRSEGRKI